MNIHLRFLLRTLVGYGLLVSAFFAGYFFLWFVELEASNLNIFLWTEGMRFLLGIYILIVPVITFVNTYVPTTITKEK